MEWEKPSSDGGAPIEKYIIEKRETPKGEWKPAAEVSGDSTKGTVTGLKEGKDYEYRVVAKNAGGLGEPSEASRIQKAKHRFRKFLETYLRPYLILKNMTIQVLNFS